ncbi:MAG: hypothetical protein V3U80_01390 [Flavobacteriaceae bacterium]
MKYQNSVIIPINNKVKETYNSPENLNLGYDKNPKLIFNRILKCLERKDRMDVLLKITGKNNETFWTKNTFYKDQNTINVIVEDYNNQSVIKKVNKLYSNLIKIENNISSAYANKYLDGYLETEHITLCKIISHFLQSA